LVGDHLLLSDFGPYVIKFMNMCVDITVAVVMLLRDSGRYGLIFMTWFTTIDFPVILDG
jgi:hypothetical protein